MFQPKNPEPWHSSWINGRAPKSIAPLLFTKVKRKNITVQKALENNKWIAHISPLRTVEELQQYITLWEEMWNVPRDENLEDEIKWRWTQDGQYIPHKVPTKYSSWVGKRNYLLDTFGQQRRNLR
jgi:hypothetical protein